MKASRLDRRRQFSIWKHSIVYYVSRLCRSSRLHDMPHASPLAAPAPTHAQSFNVQRYHPTDWYTPDNVSSQRPGPTFNGTTPPTGTPGPTTASLLSAQVHRLPPALTFSMSGYLPSDPNAGSTSAIHRCQHRFSGTSITMTSRQCQVRYLPSLHVQSFNASTAPTDWYTPTTASLLNAQVRRLS